MSSEVLWIMYLFTPSLSEPSSSSNVGSALPEKKRGQETLVTWNCSSGHGEVVSHIPQLEGPTTKNIQLCTGVGGVLWEEKGKK